MLLKNKIKEIIKFTNTIRFKLTLFYSLITFLFVGLLVFSLNVYLNNYLKSEPPIKSPRIWVREFYPIPNSDDFLIKLEETELKTIRQVRLQDLRKIQQLSIISIFPLAIISFIVGYVVSGKFLKPITNLQDNISLIRREDLGKTIPVENDDEVGKLVKSFNEMSLRLKNSFDTQDRFVQDAQHELKTPLTIIQTNLDTILDDPNASKEEMKEAISNSLEGIKQMKSLTNYLLDLTLPAEAEKKNVNINELIERQINLLEPYSKNLNVKLEFAPQNKEIILKANETSLERAAFNIIENAIKYSASAEDALVIVATEKNKDSIVISVEDNGQGIPEKQRRKIFERFYRLDKSRNKNTGGFGLGLAIAKKFVEDNGGKIELESRTGKTVFRLSF